MTKTEKNSKTKKSEVNLLEIKPIEKNKTIKLINSRRIRLISKLEEKRKNITKTKKNIKSTLGRNRAERAFRS
jgi:hypothetical protein